MSSGSAIFRAKSFPLEWQVENCVQTLHSPLRQWVGAEFLAKHYHQHSVYIPQPTWGNHPEVFTMVGLSPKYYCYYDPETRGLNFQGLLEDLSSAPSGAIVLLHACLNWC